METLYQIILRISLILNCSNDRNLRLGSILINEQVETLYQIILRTGLISNCSKDIHKSVSQFDPNQRAGGNLIVSLPNDENPVLG